MEEIRQKLADRGLTLSDSPASGNGAARPATIVRAAHRRGPHPGERRRAATRAGEPPAATPGRASSDDDAIDLLSVAGAPVLKRAIPVAAALAAAVLVVIRLRIRRRRSRA